MPTRHSVYGGSNASMWLNCPGGVALRAMVPKRPAGRAAIEGSAQHEVMEQLLLDPDKTPGSFLGSTVLGVMIEKHHIDAIAIALEEYMKIEATFPEDAEAFCEREVAMTDEAFGTMDAGFVHGARGAIIDFKFGQQEVEADSDQGMVYGVYALKSIPSFAKITELELHIIQPALDPATDTKVVSVSTLETFTTTVGTAIRVSKQPNSPYVEGEWCTWCDAKLACPAKLSRLDTLTAPQHVLSLDETAERLTKIKSWQKWAEEAQDRLQHEIEHGAQVKGWKLVAKRAIRKWTDEAAAILAFKKAKVPATKYMVTELVSPAKAEKLIPKKQVNELATPVSSGNTIAPDSDPRPEVMSTVLLDKVLKRA